MTHDSRLSAPIISRLKIIARLDIAERRKPQDGRVSLSLGAKKIDVRVSTLPSSYGERVVLRLLDKQAAQINIGDLLNWEAAGPTYWGIRGGGAPPGKMSN